MIRIVGANRVVFSVVRMMGRLSPKDQLVILSRRVHALDISNHQTRLTEQIPIRPKMILRKAIDQLRIRRGRNLGASLNQLSFQSFVIRQRWSVPPKYPRGRDQADRSVFRLVAMELLLRMQNTNVTAHPASKILVGSGTADVSWITKMNCPPL